MFYNHPFSQLTESLTGLTYVLAAIAIVLKYKYSCGETNEIFNGPRLGEVADFQHKSSIEELHFG